MEHLGLTRHHQKTVERMWHMVSKCKEMQQEYTGNNNVTRHLNPPYLLSNLAKLNMFADSMENRLGKSYTTQLINCYGDLNGFDASCRSTVNLAFLRLQPKMTSSFLFIILLICGHVVFLYATEYPRLEDHSNKSSTNVPTPIYPQKQLPLLEGKKHNHSNSLNL